MRMATKPKLLRLNERILDAFEDYCRREEKRFTPLIEELMLKYLKGQHAWPPKAKEGK